MCVSVCVCVYWLVDDSTAELQMKKRKTIHVTNKLQALKLRLASYCILYLNCYGKVSQIMEENILFNYQNLTG